MKTVIVSDDHPMTLLGTKEFVTQLGYLVLETYSNGINALNSIITYEPDIAIIDISMPGLTGLEILHHLSQKKVRTKIIVLTMHKEVGIFRKADELGAYGYILKDYAETELKLCLDNISNGYKYVSEYLGNDLISDTEAHHSDLSLLSVTERKIVELIALRRTSKQIGKLLFISEKTVEGYRTNIIQKLGLPKEKNSLLMWAMQNVKAKSV